MYKHRIDNQERFLIRADNLVATAMEDGIPEQTEQYLLNQALEVYSMWFNNRVEYTMSPEVDGDVIFMAFKTMKGAVSRTVSRKTLLGSFVTYEI